LRVPARFALIGDAGYDASPLQLPSVRAGWTIWQTGQMPGASRLNIISLLFLVFHVFRLLIAELFERASKLQSFLMTAFSL